ncbi:STAS domain containing protein [Nitzschia inconspicua]|uniref:STAS domain containing protein n=1 Tax=Nitzschia inconspicua TaxID=303405 RepID=A0A9K3LNU5_9STRA|nr:STAS domain containing protein [Nitzschia inconspicua]KAG7365632.1 STAS domain containing protein [Nitzschia inconspicua]
MSNDSESSAYRDDRLDGNNVDEVGDTSISISTPMAESTGLMDLFVPPSETTVAVSADGASSSCSPAIRMNPSDISSPQENDSVVVKNERTSSLLLGSTSPNLSPLQSTLDSMDEWRTDVDNQLQTSFSTPVRIKTLTEASSSAFPEALITPSSSGRCRNQIIMQSTPRPQQLSPLASLFEKPSPPPRIPKLLGPSQQRQISERTITHANNNNNNDMDSSSASLVDMAQESSSLLQSQFFFAASRHKSLQQQQQQKVEAFQPSKSSSSFFCCCWTTTLYRKIYSILPYPTTVAGSAMFLLYHVVFCLANGSAITRPSSTSNGNENDTPPLLGNMAKWTSIGIFVSCPVLIHRLGNTDNNGGIPALYPSADLFLAPFLAEAAKVVDQIIVATAAAATEDGYDDDDAQQQMAVWFGSFAVLSAIGMALAGSFLWLAATFQLANLGTYLPYSVLCGFFSAVGVLLWALAFSVDTSGHSWKDVFLSGPHSNPALIWDSICHHLPSLFVGILMNRLGPKNPFFVIMLIVATVLIFYIIMLITGTSLEQAQQNHWFWSYDELATTATTTKLVNTTTITNFTTPSSIHRLLPEWTLPPTPFGAWASIVNGNVNWNAVGQGLHNMVALAFLYLLRSSIHASALTKNVKNLVRRIPIKQTTQLTTTTTTNKSESPDVSNDVEEEVEGDDDDGEDDDEGTLLLGKRATSGAYHQATNIVESVRNQVEILSMSLADQETLRGQNRKKKTVNFSPNTETSLQETSGDLVGDNPAVVSTEKKPTTTQDYYEIWAKPSQRTLEEVFVEYGYALFVVSLCGGFGCCPTVATSNTMYAIGAGDPAPQYGSVLLLLIFYFTDFAVVRFIPKTAFSSLLVLGAVDTIVIWFIRPFQKMESWIEWSVVPLIVFFSLFVGFLNAVFLGIALSTFVFVTSFFQVGVVKYNATGLEIRSRIERSLIQSVWLDTHGDAIQVLVLQNYLFFGNASTIRNYIATMFEEVDITVSQRLDFAIPPVPSILVVDLSLITGMDTSTVDIFGEIRGLCKTNDCKLYLCGLSPRQKKALTKAGIKPDRAFLRRSKRQFVFFSDLDSGLGAAEDVLIKDEMQTSDILDLSSPPLLGRLDEMSGFHVALRQIDELHGVDYSEGLLPLEEYTKRIDLVEGQILFEIDGNKGVIQEGDHGLFFIESGTLRVERDLSDNATWTRTRSYFGTSALHKLESSIGPGNSSNNKDTNRLTLTGQHARLGTIARRSALAKRYAGGEKAYSARGSARIGPGWVVGTNEFVSGQPPWGIFRAATLVRLHHLPFTTIRTIEQKDPVMILRLYKLLAHMMVRNETNTVAQLTVMRNILSAPAHSKPIPRAAAMRTMLR